MQTLFDDEQIIISNVPNRQKRFRNVSETFPMQAKMQTETFLNFFSQKVARNVKEACQGTS